MLNKENKQQTSIQTTNKLNWIRSSRFVSPQGSCSSVCPCLQKWSWLLKINGKTWKQPISHPKCLWSSAFEPGIVPVINCFKSLHFLCLRSLRNASLCGINLSGLQSWAYTESWFTHSRWEIGLWWSTGASHTPYSIHGLAPLWWRSLGSWWWTLWSSQQINKSTIKLKLGFWGGTAEAMKNICSIWVRHSVLWSCKKRLQHVKAGAYVGFWIYEDSPLV